MADDTRTAGRAAFAAIPPAASRVAAIYAVVAVAWILVSDRVALALIGEAAELSSVQTAKGLVFVLASAGLIHLLVRRERQRWHLAEARERRQAQQFEAIFRTSPAGILITDVEEDRHVAANDRLLQLLRFRREEMVGRAGACRCGPRVAPTTPSRLPWIHSGRSATRWPCSKTATETCAGCNGPPCARALTDATTSWRP